MGIFVNVADALRGFKSGRFPGRARVLELLSSCLLDGVSCFFSHYTLSFLPLSLLVLRSTYFGKAGRSLE